MIPAGWTPERVETLTKLWLAGYSAAQVAKQLGGCSRNAVIGKIMRLGLGGRDKPSKPLIAKPLIRRSAPQMKPVRVKLIAVPAEPKIKVAEVEISTTVLSPDAAPWDQRRFGQCAFPVSGHSSEVLSCCNPAVGQYCPGHARIMFQPKRKSSLEKLADVRPGARRRDFTDGYSGFGA